MSKEPINECDLVSIIMPAYNSQDFISESISSIINQSYMNWELIIADDCSTDNTVEIIKNYMDADKRIKLFSLEKNSGAAVARNTAIKEARGKYLAFLDSDDLWDSEKLTVQINFMKKNNYSFTCTSYSKVDEDGNTVGKTVVPGLVNNYYDVLKNSPGNSTVVYNCSVLGKFYSPNIKRRNDFVMWLQVIKKAENLYGIQEPYTYYRIRENSLSRNKMKLLKYQWKVYREYENLSFIVSLYLLLKKIVDVIKK